MVQQYLDHSREILTSERANFKGGSKKMGLISLFGYQNEYDLREGFPLMTTKKMGVKMIANELIWFMSGESNIKYLVDNKVHIWDDNGFDHNLKGMVGERIFPESALERYSEDWQKAKGEYIDRIKEGDEFAERWGDLGPVYGSQWRKWGITDDDGSTSKVDQLGDLVEGLRKKPTGKRHIVTAWNPGEVDNMALPPCHVMYQATANEDDEMELQLYQRSCDMFLGVPFNIASYAMFTQVIAQNAGLEPKTFIHTFGDSHFYAGDGERSQWYKENFSELKKVIRNIGDRKEYPEVLEWLNDILPAERPETKGQDHVTAIIEQLARTPKKLPKLKIADKEFDKLTIDDFALEEYSPYPTIKREMAV
ncbi:thymidylate synthase [Candidatus Pacearchaeota archaeon]|nr:thymidylate synthase [Candidatus Pacearchaeota archaeon]|tara:strand:- start:711 stop:1805 length:1095 start_codon:yes stop_codon:yes gene_type:complete